MKKLILVLACLSCVAQAREIPLNGSTLRTLMGKYDCQVKILKNAYIRKNQDSILIGEVELVIRKVDQENLRVLKKGRKIKNSN